MGGGERDRRREIQIYIYIYMHIYISCFFSLTLSVPGFWQDIIRQGVGRGGGGRWIKKAKMDTHTYILVALSVRRLTLPRADLSGGGKQDSVD